MKIRAIRVAECGRFDAPSAVEGLSGGLDVLVGPNEFGKSTLLRALKAALFERHTTRKAELEALRPYRGGAPLIEVDLEVAGELWRLRKRFLAERMAEITSLSGGQVARGADAEGLLERLLGIGDAAGRFALLWLEQGATLAAPEPGEKAEAVLRSAIGREVASAAGGDRARRVRARVQAALAELVTAGRGQKRGRYLAAQKEVEAREAALAKARQSLAAVEDLLSRLGRIEEQARASSDSGARAERAKRVTDAEATLAKAREDIAGRDRARVVVAEARGAHTAAGEAAHELLSGLAEIERLQAEAVADADTARAVSAELAAATDDCAALAERLATARLAGATAEAELVALRAAERRQDLAQRHQKATEADRRTAELRQALLGFPRDEQPVRDARRLSGLIAETEVRLEAQSASITIAYEPGAAGRIRLDGRSLDDGERVVAEAAVVLDIAGIGRITVVPGTTADHARMRSELAAHRDAFAAVLAGGGATDLAALEARHDMARRIAAELAEVEAHVAALAPQGLARLSAELVVLDRDAPSSGLPTAARDVVAIEADLARWRSELGGITECLTKRQSERERLGRDDAALSARTAERARRLVAVEAGLPPPDERRDRRTALEAAAATASLAYDEAARALSAWTARAPDAAGLARLETELAAARDAVRRAEQEEAGLAAERARIEGALEAAQREDVAAEAATTEADAERARATLADVAEEVAALQLLDHELAAEETRLQSLYVAPVTARLGPYLATVFPDAHIELGAGYTVAGLSRGTQSETLEQLSDGTREQIGVLVRLAFARLLAEQGLAVPLVLDDALVYSDDARIGAMHRALEQAGAAHQVIVLSCREQAFAGLDGHRLELRPWQLR